MNTLPPPPPHAVGPEKSVLSILFQDPAMIDDAASLTEDHFHLLAHREIFRLMRDLHDRKQEVELVSFIQRLIDRGKLDIVGGPSAVSDIYTYAPDPSRLPGHIKILTDHLARRQSITLAREIERVAFESEDAADIIAATSTPVSKIHDLLTDTGPAANIRSVLSSCMGRFEKLCKGEVEPGGIQTSLDEINHRFRGLNPKQTIVISGRPGGGKTTLATQLTMDAALAGHNSLVLSLEMPAEAMMNRMIAYAARLPGEAITDPVGHAQRQYGANAVTRGMLRPIKAAYDAIAAAPLHIEDLTGASVHQIIACIRRAHRKQPLEVVMVDFAQRIRPAPEMKKETKEQQLAHASNHLADITKELGFCLLLGSQVNKAGAAKHAEAINEDADLHLQIAQTDAGEDARCAHVGITVEKDRHCGQQGRILPIVLDGPMMRFIPKT